MILKAKGDRKVCSACRADLPLPAFTHNRAAVDGLDNQCRVCKAAAQRKYVTANPVRHRARHAMHRYGLSFDDYLEMVAAADGRCTACGRESSALEVDHCHATGTVRGLVCKMCNIALGAVEDDPERLLALVRYLARVESEWEE